MNLKKNFHIIVFLVAFGIVITVSFRHEKSPETPEAFLASSVAVDQVSLGVMHTDSAPTNMTGPPAPHGEESATITPAASDLAQLQVLDQILTTKDDNDPRLDTHLKALSPAAKGLMRGRYASLKTEKRNERGTIVFLIGRNLKSDADIGFLHDVINEAPCRSLANCEREDQASIAPEHRHFEGTNEVTLAYPQIVALKALEAYINSASHAPALSASALAELEIARRSPVRKIASLAEEITHQYHSAHP